MIDMQNVLMFITGAGIWIWGYYAAKSEAKRVKPSDPIESKILRDIDTMPMGSMMVITYPGHLTNEQRTRIQQLVEEKVGERMKVMVLEGGLKATVLTENSMDIQPDSPWPNR